MSHLPAAVRHQVHLRRITCTGFAREDGLWDIEGRLIDTKPEVIELPERRLQPDEPIHEMLVCLTVDFDLTIRDAWARTIHSPYRVCGDITASYAQLTGLRIAPGFTQQVKRLFRSTAGCSHLTELLPPMATTAYQVLWAERAKSPESESGASSPLGGCHALRLDGEVVRLYRPEHYRAAEDLESPST